MEKPRRSRPVPSRSVQNLMAVGQFPVKGKPTQFRANSISSRISKFADSILGSNFTKPKPSLEMFNIDSRRPRSNSIIKVGPIKPEFQITQQSVKTKAKEAIMVSKGSSMEISAWDCTSKNNQNGGRLLVHGTHQALPNNQLGPTPSPGHPATNRGSDRKKIIPADQYILKFRKILVKCIKDRT